MIDLIQTSTIVLIVLANLYQLKNFRLMDDRLRELELKQLEVAKAKAIAKYKDGKG